MHLAQINIAKALAEMDDPIMHGFVSRLDEINALADDAPGFVWRLQTDDGDALNLRVFDDPMLIINMSVWDDVASLRDFTYKTMHVEVFKERKKWFTKLGRPHLAMWWVPVGHTPTLDEAKEKLELIAERGPTPEAFTFSKVFAEPTTLETSA